MSDCEKRSARSGNILAPLAAYSASGYPASAPASAFNHDFKSGFRQSGITPGTNATRRSPGKCFARNTNDHKASSE